MVQFFCGRSDVIAAQPVLTETRCLWFHCGSHLNLITLRSEPLCLKNCFQFQTRFPLGANSAITVPETTRRGLKRQKEEDWDFIYFISQINSLSNDVTFQESQCSGWKCCTTLLCFLLPAFLSGFKIQVRSLWLNITAHIVMNYRHACTLLNKMWCKEAIQTLWVQQVLWKL